MKSRFRLRVHSATVSEGLDEYLSAGTDPDITRSARFHNALPLWLDTGGCVALRPNGELISWAWDEPEKLLELDVAGERDRRMVHVARAQGAQRYPQIAGLAPVRDEHSQVCPSCHGSGKMPNVPDGFVCECGGVGWISW